MNPSYVVLDVGDVLISTVPNAPWTALSKLGGRPADRLVRDPAVSALTHSFNCGRVDTVAFCATMATLAQCHPSEVPDAWRSVIGPAQASMLRTVRPWMCAGRLLLASDTDPLHWPAILDRLGPAWHDTPALLSWRFGADKDDPTYFRRLAELLPCSPNHALYVDDQERHVNAAQAIGLTALRHSRAQETVEMLRRLLPAARQPLSPTRNHSHRS